MLLIGFIFLSSFSNATNANAEKAFTEGLYFKGELGAVVDGRMGTAGHQNLGGSETSYSNKTLAPGLIIGFGLGKKLSKKIRGELLAKYRIGMYLDTVDKQSHPNSMYDASIESWTVMTNAYFDISSHQVRKVVISPYIMGGLGVAINKMGTASKHLPGSTLIELEGDSKTDFAWNVGTGIGIDLIEQLTFDLGYQYADFGDIRSGTQLTHGLVGNLPRGTNEDLVTHEINIGLRYNFKH